MSVLLVCITALQTNIVFGIPPFFTLLGPKAILKKLMHPAVNYYCNLVLSLLNDEG